MGARDSTPFQHYIACGAAMAFNVLFGSGIVPRAAQRATGGAVCRSIARPMTSLTTSVAPRAAAPLQLSVRSYGTRSVWNVGQGQRTLFIWLVGWTIVGGLMQDLIGPWAIFHE